MANDDKKKRLHEVAKRNFEYVPVDYEEFSKKASNPDFSRRLSQDLLELEKGGFIKKAPTYEVLISAFGATPAPTATTAPPATPESQSNVVPGGEPGAQARTFPKPSELQRGISNQPLPNVGVPPVGVQPEMPPDISGTPGESPIGGQPSAQESASQGGVNPLAGAQPQQFQWSGQQAPVESMQPQQPVSQGVGGISSADSEARTTQVSPYQAGITKLGEVEAGFIGGIGSGLQGISELGYSIDSKIANVLEGTPFEGGFKKLDKPSDSWLYQAGQGLQDFAEKDLYRNPEYVGGFSSDVAGTLGQLGSIAATGGFSSAGGILKLGRGVLTNRQLIANGVKQLFSRPTISGAFQMVGAETQAARELHNMANTMDKESYVLERATAGEDADEAGRAYDKLRTKTEDEVASAMIPVSLFGGALEAIPLERLFVRLGKPAKNYIVSAFKNGGIQAVEEATQEVIQQTIINAGVGNTYNEAQKLTTGLQESAEVGGVVGFILGATLTALGGKRANIRNRVQEGVITKEQAIEELKDINKAETLIQDKLQALDNQVGLSASEDNKKLMESPEAQQFFDNNKPSETNPIVAMPTEVETVLDKIADDILISPEGLHEAYQWTNNAVKETLENEALTPAEKGATLNILNGMLGDIDKANTEGQKFVEEVEVASVQDRVPAVRPEAELPQGQTPESPASAPQAQGESIRQARRVRGGTNVLPSSGQTIVTPAPQGTQESQPQTQIADESEAITEQQEEPVLGGVSDGGNQGQGGQTGSQLRPQESPQQAEGDAEGQVTTGTPEALADVESRRKEEINELNIRDANSVEAKMPNNPNHKKDGLGISVGDKFNEGQKIIVVNNKPDENYDGRENPYKVITKVIEPQLHDDSGKMIQSAQVEVTLFNTKEEADIAIQKEYEKIKSLQGKKQDKINDKFDAEYVDAVKNGTMTREQAIQALEQAGRKDSKAYSELKAGQAEGAEAQVTTGTPEALADVESTAKALEEKFQNQDDDYYEIAKSVMNELKRNTSSKDVSQAYHNAKAKPESERTSQESQLISAVEELLTPKSNAVQIESPAKVPVQPEAGVSTEVAQGSPEAKPESPAQQGKAPEGATQGKAEVAPTEATEESPANKQAREQREAKRKAREEAQKATEAPEGDTEGKKGQASPVKTIYDKDGNPTEIGGYKVIEETESVGDERVFKVVDENGNERYLTADGKELLLEQQKGTSVSTVETTTKPKSTTQEAGKERAGTTETTGQEVGQKWVDKTEDEYVSERVRDILDNDPDFINYNKLGNSKNDIKNKSILANKAKEKARKEYKDLRDSALKSKSLPNKYKTYSELTSDESVSVDEQRYREGGYPQNHNEEISRAEHKDAVSDSLENGFYQKAISEGRMTANDAKAIIESAGLEVPQDILSQATPITPESPKKPKAMTDYESRLEERRQAYKPGNTIIRDTNTREKVIDYTENPNDPNDWSVTTQLMDKDGKLVESPRTHKTPPTKKEVQRSGFKTAEEIKTGIQEDMEPDTDARSAFVFPIGLNPSFKFDPRLPKQVVAWMKKKFRPGGGLMPKNIFGLQRAKEGFIEKQIQKAVYNIRDVRKAIKDSYPKGNPTKADVKKINEYLTGNTAIELPPAMYEVLDRLRDQVDALSQKMKDEGVIDDKLSIVFDKNMGVYFTRSYKIYQDPDTWIRHIETTPEGQAIRNRAVNWLQGEINNQTEKLEKLQKRKVRQAQRFREKARELPDGPLKEAMMFKAFEAERIAENYDNKILEQSDRDAQAEITAYLHSKDGPLAYIRESQVGQKDLGVVSKRQDISPEIRALLGEITDPLAKYMDSIIKMSTLLANHNFLTAARKEGVASGLFSEGKPKGDKVIPIAPKGSKTMSPLDGVYATPEIAQAFQDADKVLNNPWWVKRWIQFNGIVKMGKTVGSPLTHVRNFIANPIIEIANGSFSVKGLKKAIEANASLLGVESIVSLMGDKSLSPKQRNEAVRQYVERLIELQVIGDGSNYRDIMQYYEDFNDSRFDYREVIEPQIKKLGKGTLNTALDLYRAEDDFWKIHAFESEKAKYKNAYGDTKTSEELDKIVADVVLKTRINYSMAPEGVKDIRKFPLTGSFVTFPAEVMRIAYGIPEQAIQEMGNTNADKKTQKKIRNIGIQRMAGFIVAIGSTQVVDMVSRAIVQMDDEEEEARRKFLAPWAQNSKLIWVSKDTYIDTGYSDSFAFIKKPVTAFMRAPSSVQGFIDAGMELFSPFMTPEIGTKTLAEVAQNKDQNGNEIYSTSLPPSVIASRIISHIGKNAEPGIISTARRIYKGETGEYSQIGKKYSSLNEAITNLTGQKVESIDWDKAVYFKVRSANEDVKVLNGIYKQESKKFADDDEKSRIATAEAVNEGVRANIQELRDYYRSAIKIGISPGKAVRIMKDAGLSTETIEMSISNKPLDKYQYLIIAPVGGKDVVIDREKQRNLGLNR